VTVLRVAGKLIAARPFRDMIKERKKFRDARNAENTFLRTTGSRYVFLFPTPTIRRLPPPPSILPLDDTRARDIIYRVTDIPHNIIIKG